MILEGLEDHLFSWTPDSKLIEAIGRLMVLLVPNPDAWNWSTNDFTKGPLYNHISPVLWIG